MRVKLFMLLLLSVTISLAITSDIKGFDVKRNGESLPAGACVKGGEVLTVSNTGLGVKDVPTGAMVSSKGCVADLPGTGVCFSCGGVKLTSTEGWTKTLKYSYQSCPYEGKTCYISREDEFIVPSGESHYGEEFTVGLYAGAAYAQWFGVETFLFCANKDTKTRSFLIGECSSDSDCPNGFCGSDCMCHSLEEEGWTHPNHNSYGDGNIRRTSAWGQVKEFSEENPFDSNNVNRLWEAQLSGSPKGAARWAAPISFVEPDSDKNLVAVYEGYDSTSVSRSGGCTNFLGRYLLTKVEKFSAIHKIAIFDGSTGKKINEINLVPYVDTVSRGGLFNSLAACQQAYNDPLVPSSSFVNERDSPALEYMAFVPASESQTLVFLYRYKDYSTTANAYKKLAYVEKPWDSSSSVSMVTKIDQTNCGDGIVDLDDDKHYVLAVTPMKMGLYTDLFVTYLDDGKIRGANVRLSGDTLRVYQSKDGCRRKSYDLGNAKQGLLSAGTLQNVEFTGSPGTIEMGSFSLIQSGGTPVTYTGAWRGISAYITADWDERTMLLSNPYYASSSADSGGFVYDIAGYARNKFYVRRVHATTTSGDVSGDVELLGEYSLADYDGHSSMAKFLLKDNPDHYFMAVVKPGGQGIMFVSVPKTSCDPSKDSLCSYKSCGQGTCKWEYSLPFTAAGLAASADLDGDGNDEIILAGEDERIHFLRWTKSGGFSVLGESKPLGGEITGIAVDDVDRDGFLDILASVDTTVSGKLVVLSWLPPCKVSFTVDNMVCAEDGATALYSFSVLFPRAGMQGNARVYHTYWGTRKDYTDYPEPVGSGAYGYSHTFSTSAGDIDLSTRAGKVSWSAVEITPVYHGVTLPDSACLDKDLMYILGGKISPELPAGVTRPGDVSFTVEQQGEILNQPKAGTKIPADVTFIADNIKEYTHCKVSEGYDGFGPGSEIALDMNGDGVYESWKFDSDVSDTIKYENVRGASCVPLGDTSWRACEPTSYGEGKALSEGWIVVQDPGHTLKYVLGGSCGTTTDQKLLEPGTYPGAFKASYTTPGKTFEPRAVFKFHDLEDTKEDGSQVTRKGPACTARTTVSTASAPECSVSITPSSDYLCYGQPAEFTVSYDDELGSPGEVTVDFGGGNKKTVTVNSGDTVLVSNQYPAEGTYSVRADAVGKESGARCSTEVQFTVNERREDVEPFVQPRVVCTASVQELVLTCTDQKGAPVPAGTVTGWSVTVNGEDKSSECSAGSSTCTIPLSGFDTQDFVYTAACQVSGTECYVYAKTSASTSGDFNCSLAGQPAEEEGAVISDVSCSQVSDKGYEEPLDCVVTRSGKTVSGVQSVESVNCPGVEKDHQVVCHVKVKSTVGGSMSLEANSGTFPLKSLGTSGCPPNQICNDLTTTVLFPQGGGEATAVLKFLPNKYGAKGTVSLFLLDQNGFPEDSASITVSVVEAPGKCSEDCKYCATQTACQSNPNCEWTGAECKYRQVGGLPEYPEMALLAVAGFFAVILLKRK